MPYNNEQNRRIASHMRTLTNNFLTNAREQKSAPNMDYDDEPIGFFKYPKSNFSGGAEYDEYEGHGYSGGSGFAQGTNMDTGFEYVDGAKPKRTGGRKKKAKKEPNLNELGNIEDGETSSESGSSDSDNETPQGMGRKKGGGIFDAIGDFLGLGKSKKKGGVKSDSTATDGVLPGQVISLPSRASRKSKDTARIDYQISAATAPPPTGKVETADGAGKMNMKAGVGRYKKKSLKGGAVADTGRAIGGSKALKLREEQKGSSFSGFGKKTNSKGYEGLSWKETIQKVKQNNPELKGVKAIINYIKEHKIYKKKE